MRLTGCLLGVTFSSQICTMFSLGALVRALIADGDAPSPTTTEIGDEVKLGDRVYRFGVPGSPVQPMKDSNHLLGDPEALRAELQSQGFLLIRGVHDRDEVLAARNRVLQHLAGLGGRLDPSRPVEEGVLLRQCGATCVPFMEGVNDITLSDEVSRVLTGPRITGFFRRLFGTETLTFNYKWLRAVHNGGFTGAHYDSVYMSRGTPNLVTMWTPFGDVGTRMGTIAVLPKSNCNDACERLRQTYGAMDAEAEKLDGTGWFTKDPDEILKRFGGQWLVTDFRAGDALFFTMKTLHMSTTNVSNFARVSCDTRWQSNTEPADPRYVKLEDGQELGHSDVKFGVHAETAQDKASGPTIEEKKAEWGFSPLQ